jgi:PEP-CTERM/exosortase A-associated glycosyltransferase
VRVLHVLHTSVPALATGYSVRSDYIMRFQREQGIDSAVVTSAQHPNGETLHEVHNGFAFWRTQALEGKPPFGVREAKLMRRLQGRIETAIREWRPALVHAHSPMLVGIPAVHAARNFGLPIVYELRDLWENPSVDRGKFKEGSALYRAAQLFENYVLHRADALVTICQTLKDAIEPRKGANVPVHVVDNGVDVEKFKPRPKNQALEAKWKLQGKKVVVYLGTFQPYEGVELLVRSIQGVAKHVPNAHLLIVGGGGEHPQIVKLAKDLGLDGLVTFTGRVPHDEVADMFPLGDLFVYPRLLTYTTALTTPLKPLEAMSMARPALVSDIPPMRELIARPGESGLLFKPGDQADLERTIAAALQDAALLQRLGEAGRRYVLAERSWPTIVSRYQGIYADTIARAQARHRHRAAVATA